MCFVFHTYAFDDIMTFEYQKKLKFDYLNNEKSFGSEIKNIFPCFTRALLDTLTKSAKI